MVVCISHLAIHSLHSVGRLTHVMEGSHDQWSRGWLQAKEPYRNDLIKTIDPALGRVVRFVTCYYNEDHLVDKYQRSLVVGRWGSRELAQFPLTPRGASFASSQKPLIVGKGTARPVAGFTGNDGSEGTRSGSNSNNNSMTATCRCAESHWQQRFGNGPTRLRMGRFPKASNLVRPHSSILVVSTIGIIRSRTSRQNPKSTDSRSGAFPLWTGGDRRRRRTPKPRNSR